MSDTAPASNLEKFTPRVFSGIQPSGGLTLGNYLGAMKRFVDMQDAGTHETVYCMVDMHAITVWQDPADLARNTRELCAGFIASGIDPERSILFNQSQVPEHAQLGWIFNCVARMGWMSRMTQWKDKAGKNQQNASLGLFAYPALMAADILVYHATHVPVGEDQKQHIELARDIAQKFNNDFDRPDFFPQPEPLIQGPATRVMSLRDGTKKMSKSDPSELARITMLDQPDEIARKIRKAKTDPDALPDTVEALEARPEAANLLGIYAALADKPVAATVDEFAGAQFSKLKEALAELATATIGPIGTEMQRLMDDPAGVDAALAVGAARARDIASGVMEEVRAAVGFLQKP